MTYVTYVWRSDIAENNDTTIDNTLSGAGIFISGGWCVGIPSSSGAVPISFSDTAVCVYDAPSGINSTNSTITSNNYRVRVRNISAGEALWMTATYDQ